MQRLAALDHHVVGHVDDVADRPQPDHREPRLHPERRRPDADAANDARGVVRAEIGRLHAHTRDRDAAAAASSTQRDSAVAAGVAPVSAATSRATPSTLRQSPRFGVTDELEDRVLGAEIRDERVPDRRVGRQDQDARRHRLRESPSSRAEHSMPCDAWPRIVALLDALAVRAAPCPGGASATLSPACMLLAPQTTRDGLVAASHLTEPQTVGIRVRRGALDRRDLDLRPSSAGAPRPTRPRDRPSPSASAELVRRRGRRRRARAAS